MKVLRVNVKDNSVIFEKSPIEFKDLGGRALISKIMTDEVDPTCDPIGGGNKLIIAPGILAGTTVSCVNRISVGGKSPLTGTIKESNGGGTTAYKLARLGIKAIIIEGIPDGCKTQILYISKENAELLPGEELKGKGVYETGEMLKKRFHRDIGMVIIGPAGERLYRSAGIANGDIDGIPSRYSGRGGLGAVMGSKGIKAIVIDDKDANQVEIKDKELYLMRKYLIFGKLLKKVGFLSLHW